eukprot:5301795-Prymnesium_polylepis.1
MVRVYRCPRIQLCPRRRVVRHTPFLLIKALPRRDARRPALTPSTGSKNSVHGTYKDTCHGTHGRARRVVPCADARWFT